MRRISWIWAGLVVAAVLAGGGAQAQGQWGQDRGGYRQQERYQQRQPEREYRHRGFVEREGSARRYYDWRGEYEGRSERSGGGGVRRFYDTEGRYLGREEVERDFRRR